MCTNKCLLFEWGIDNRKKNLQDLLMHVIQLFCYCKIAI